MLTGSQLVFGLQQRAADPCQCRSHPFQELGGRRDRIRSDKADTATNRAVAGGFIAADQPAPAFRSVSRRQRRHPADARRGVHSGPQRRQICLERFIGAFPRIAHGRFERSNGEAGERPCKAQRHHVGPAPGNRLRQFFQRPSHEVRAGRLEYIGRFALVRVADQHAGSVERDLVREAAHVLPVDREQHVEPIVQRVDRRARKPHQRGRFAAAYLGPAGAYHETVASRLRGRLEQQRPGGHHAAAATAGERDGDARDRPARRLRRRQGAGRRRISVHRGLHVAFPLGCIRAVNRLYDRIGLTQIKAVAIALPHDATSNYALRYCNATIRLEWVAAALRQRFRTLEATRHPYRPEELNKWISMATAG